jgi:hypothetical protein
MICQNDVDLDPPQCLSEYFNLSATVPLKIPRYLVSNCQLDIRILIFNGAHSSYSAFCFTSYKDWLRRDEKNRKQSPMAE